MKKHLFITLISLVACITMAAQETFVHPWYGKKVAYLGDSITDPRIKSGTEKWWTFLSGWLNITPYCYGKSGREWTDIPRQVRLLNEEHGQDVDAIIIFVGTNDFKNGAPLGEWYEESEKEVEYTINKKKGTQKRKHRELVMDSSTFRGRINVALSLCKELYPTKQIVLLTPIHRSAFCPNDTNIQPDERYTNVIGEWFEEYVECTKETANVWAVPVIDINAASGLYPMMDVHAQYFTNPQTDRLHPNDAGYQRIARTLYYQLLTLPCTF